jgi:hypothetical protein
VLLLLLLLPPAPLPAAPADPPGMNCRINCCSISTSPVALLPAGCSPCLLLLLLLAALLPRPAAAAADVPEGLVPEVLLAVAVASALLLLLTWRPAR